MGRILARIARLFIFGVVALAVGLVGVAYVQTQPPAEQGATAQAEGLASEVLDTLVAERSDLNVTITATGALSPEKQVPLIFEASGRVAEIAAPQGARVQAGDLIARLDTSTLDSSIAEAEIAVSLQRASLDALTSSPREVDLAVAQAAVESAQAALNAAYSTGNPNAAEAAALQAELARNRLYQGQLQRDMAMNTTTFSPSISGFIPDGVEIPPEIIEQLNQGLAGLIPSFSTTADPDQLAAGLRQAEFGVQIADANAAASADSGADPGSVASANAGLVAAQAAVDRLLNGPSDMDLQAAEIALAQAQNAVEQARAAAARSRLVAPFAGIVAQNNLAVDEPPPSQNAAVLLLDDSALYVDLAVDETDVVELLIGQPVTLRFDALPDAELTGTVAEIAVAPTRAGGLVSFAVRVRVDPTDAPVRIGMSATASVIVRSKADVLVVPNRFIRIDTVTSAAFLTIEREPGVYQEVPVRLGIRNATESEVVEGIEAGTTLVLLPRGSLDLFN